MKSTNAFSPVKVVRFACAGCGVRVVLVLPRVLAPFHSWALCKTCTTAMDSYESAMDAPQIAQTREAILQDPTKLQEILSTLPGR